MAVFASAVANVLAQKERERRAVQAIRHLGGKIVYQWEKAGTCLSPGPEWLKGLVGHDILANVVRVNMCFTSFGDKDVDALTALKRLESLSAAATKITDAGAEKISRLRSLRSLSLAGTGISNAGLGSLDNLQDLESLSLDATNVTDEGIKHLLKLRKLRELVVTCTHVTDHGILQLRQISTLRRLEVDRWSADEKTITALKTALPLCEVEYSPM